MPTFPSGWIAACQPLSLLLLKAWEVAIQAGLKLCCVPIHFPFFTQEEVTSIHAPGGPDKGEAHVVVVWAFAPWTKCAEGGVYGCWNVANSRRLSSVRERAQALQSQGDTYNVTRDLLFVTLHWLWFSILSAMLYCKIPICRELVDVCKTKPQLTRQFMVWIITVNLAWRKCLNSTSQNLQLSDVLLPCSKPCNAQTL